MKYLNDKIDTLEKLKKEYHKWAILLHPDAGGREQDMKILNSEYDILFKRVKCRHLNKDGEIYTKDTNEVSDDFKELIASLAILNGIKVEIIGSFIWVHGDTKPHKDKLKDLDFKWHRIKKCWYLPPEGYRRFCKKEYSMADIRSMYEVSYETSVELKEITE